MGWINEIVGICMAAHFDWAWDEEKESIKREEMGSGEVRASEGGDEKLWERHTHARTDTHIRMYYLWKPLVRSSPVLTFN